jgi:hypothetical protein
MSSLSQVIGRQWALLSLAAIIVCCYVLLNAVGLFVLGGRAKSAEIVIFVAPVLALPFFLSFALSPSVASVLLWLDFLILHVGYVVNDWPHFSNLITALRMDWPLLLVAVLTQMAASRERKYSAISLNSSSPIIPQTKDR